jgi:hypothetical protein
MFYIFIIKPDLTPPSPLKKTDNIGVGAGIAQWYSAGLRTGWSEVRVPAEAGKFSLHHRCVQNSSEAHPASYPVGIRGYFPGGKAAGAWSWLNST